MMVFQFIGIQIFSLMYLALILIVYSSKKRFQSVENNIFKLLLIFTLFELGIDIAINYSIKYADLVPVLNSFLCKLSLFGYHTWAALLMSYVLLIGNKDGYKSIKELYQKKFSVQIGTIIVFMLAFVVFLLPLDFLYDRTYRISYIVGISSNYTYIITIIYLLIILATVLINKNKIPFVKRIPIFIFIITASIFLPIQKFNADVPVLIVPLMAFAIMIMYFTLENPDIKLIEELNELKLQAEESDRVKTKFLDNVSYNMRSPMNAIMGYSQTILTEDLSENAKEDAENINKASRTLLEMVNNTLDISKIESGLVEVNNEEYDLRLILNNISFIATNSISTSKVKFIMNVNENVPYNLIGDYDKLTKVLNNILSNSIKYTNVGKITFSVDGEVIDNYLNLTFKIKDTGIGIKEQEKEMLFKKFGRIENTETSGFEGTGLGLYLSKKLIELLGGSISFESTYGAGTVVTINVTQKMVSNDLIGSFEYISDSSKINIFDGSSNSVLIIDDNKYSNAVLERMVKLYNIKTNGVSNRDDYVELLKNKNRYDIIFIEDKLASETVFKTIQTYKNINNKDLKVIALSSETLNTSRSYFVNKGYDEYVIKPLELQKIDNLLNKYLNEK